MVLKGLSCKQTVVSGVGLPGVFRVGDRGWVVLELLAGWRRLKGMTVIGGVR